MASRGDQSVLQQPPGLKKYHQASNLVVRNIHRGLSSLAGSQKSDRFPSMNIEKTERQIDKKRQKRNKKPKKQQKKDKKGRLTCIKITLIYQILFSFDILKQLIRVIWFQNMASNKPRVSKTLFCIFMVKFILNLNLILLTVLL